MATIYVKEGAANNLNPRMKQDTYLTDSRLAVAVVKWLHMKFPSNMRRLSTVLDPGAGKGVWGQAVRDVAEEYGTNQPNITGVELRRNKSPEAYSNWIPRTDYLKWGLDWRDYGKPFDLILGNPPFKLAEPFIWHSRGILQTGGLICFLLPGDFSHSETRGKGLFMDYPPMYEISLMQRPMFLGPKGESLGNQNPNNYDVMIWGEQGQPRANFTIKDWLDWRKSGRKNDNR